MRVADKIELDAQSERELRILSKRRRVEARVQQRASMILLAAKGWRNKNIAAEVKRDRRQVALWRQRFIDGGVQALMQDATRSGRTPRVTPEVESRIVNTTLHENLPAASGPWNLPDLSIPDSSRACNHATPTGPCRRTDPRFMTAARAVDSHAHVFCGDSYQPLGSGLRPIRILEESNPDFRFVQSGM